MRVLHISTGNLFGGIESFLLTLARERQFAPQMSPAFAAFFEGTLTDELRKAGATVHMLGATRLSRPWTVIRAQEALRLALAAEVPDVVVCHSPWSHLVAARPVRSAGYPFVLAVHDALSERSLLDRLVKLFPPDAFICNSRFTAARAERLSPGRVIDVVHCPVSVRGRVMSADSRSHIRRSLGTQQDRVVIIQVSRLERGKGHSLHLAALGRLRELPGWECWMVGGGQKRGEQAYLASLVEQAKQMGIGERVRFLGQRADVADLMSAADVFCQPNVRAEPFGIVFIEALAAGLPVVATRLGGALEIVTDECGLLVDPEESSVSAALEAMVKDGALRRRLGANGPPRAAEVSDAEARLEDLFRALSKSVSGVAVKARSA